MTMHVKYIFAILIAAFSLLLPTPVGAATITLQPAAISVHQGDTFVVTVEINPPGAPAYTASVNALFTAGVLKVSAWDFDQAWLPLRQKGYDTTDNVKGIFTRTGGYPGGFNTAVRFGNVTFTALEIGKAVIKLSSNSAIYNSASSNIYNGANQVSVDVVAVGKELKQSPGGAGEVAAPSGQTAPTLFDVSAQPASKKSSMLPVYLSFIAFISVIGGLAGAMIWERVRRRRILKQDKRMDHE